MAAYLYETRATWGCWLSATRGAGGRIRANPTRRMQYAARMPNEIDPTDAQINMAKFNQSTTVPHS